MHKDPQFAALFEFDPEIERTFRRSKRHCQFKERFEEVTSTPTMAEGEDAQRKTLLDFVTPGIHSQTLSITMPLAVANNFELKLALISMV